MRMRVRLKKSEVGPRLKSRPIATAVAAQIAVDDNTFTVD